MNRTLPALRSAINALTRDKIDLETLALGNGILIESLDIIFKVVHA